MFCDTAAIQKGPLWLQMEENSSRYSSKFKTDLFLHIWDWLGSIVYPVKVMQEGEGRQEKREEPEAFPMYNQESSLGEISSQKSQGEVSFVETVNLHTVFTATDTFCVTAHLPVCREIEIVYFACWIRGSVLVTSRKSYFLREVLHYKQVIHNISVSVVGFYCSQNINHWHVTKNNIVKKLPREDHNKHSLRAATLHLPAMALDRNDS